MSEKLVRVIQTYEGLSTDTKSTKSSIAVGSTWYEYDTKQTYSFAASTWTLAESNMGRDNSTWATETVSYAHHEVHDGGAYNVTHIDSDLDTGDVFNVTFKTPNTAKWFHMVADGNNTVNSTFEICRGVTATAGTSTEATIFNKNENSANTSGSLAVSSGTSGNLVNKNATITTDGTIIFQKTMGSSGPTGGSITGARDMTERILKQNTAYSYKITALADNGRASIDLNWYEHTDKQ